MRLLLLLFMLLIISACTGQKSSILSEKVEKDPGKLTILNSSGFMGATVSGTSIEHVVVVKSSGGLNIHDMNTTITTSDPISFKGGSYPGTGGTCHSTLKSGDTCIIVILYEPLDTDGHIAYLDFSYKDSISSKSFRYTLTADSHPILTFEYGKLYDFGNKFVGSSTDLRIKVSNTGKVSAENITINNLGAPFSFKGGSYPGTGGNCGTTIVPGQYCEIIVNYSPTSNGEHIQDITLNYLNTGRPEANTLQMIAWGFYQAQLTLSVTGTDDFGTVASDASYTKVYTVTHSGGDVSATGIQALNLTSPFSRTGGTCGNILSKETGSCSIIITLNSPTSGSWSNPFTFSYHNGSATITSNRTLTAITKIRPTLSISPIGTSDFGVVRTSTSSEKTFTVTYESGEMPATGLGFSSPLPSTLSYTGGTFPGTGATCGSSLSSGNCTIKLSYSSVSNGDLDFINNFKYHNGVINRDLPSIHFKAKTEGRIAPRFSSSVGFGSVVAGQTKDNPVWISFAGGSTATSITVDSITGPFSIRGGSYPGTGGNCSTTMSSGDCYFYIRFSPLTEGSFLGTLTLKYNNGLETTDITFNLSGTGSPAAVLTLPSEGTNFGNISVNSSSERTITLRNDSSMSASSIALNTMPAGFSFKGGSYPGLGGTCSTLMYLSANSTCNLVLSFNPTAATNYSGNLVLNYYDGTTTRTVSAGLSGSAYLTSDLFISRFNTVDFGTPFVGQSPSLSFTLSHGGSSTAANISGKIITSGSDFQIISDNCPATLSNGSSCTFTVRFSPLSAGIKNSSIEVSYSDGLPKTVSRIITGRGRSPAFLSISPSSYDFGAIPTDTTEEQTFTVTHSGEVNAVSMSGISPSAGFTFKGGTYPGTGGTCSTSLTAGSSCLFIGRFTPLAVAAYSGELGIQYNNGFSNIQAKVTLSGSGSPTAVLAFGSASYDFGDIIQTTSATRTITVTHSGPIAATSLSTLPLSPPYSFTGGTYPGTGGTCGTSISSGSCTMNIDFTPTTTGVKNESLTLQYYNGSVTRQINTTLTGESLAQAIISVSETNPFNMGTTNIGGMIDKSFTLYNSGSVPGTALAGSFDQIVFNFKGGSFPGTGGTCGASLASGSSCSVVVTFAPTTAQSYSSTFTLSYHDGIRVQNEQKTLTGRGSSSLKKEYYFSLLGEEDIYMPVANSIYLGDINSNSSPDYLIVKHDMSFAEDSRLKRPIFFYPNHLGKKYIEGGRVKILKGNKILLPIFKRHNSSLKLKGYVIRSSLTGDILEKFLEERSL